MLKCKNQTEIKKSVEKHLPRPGRERHNASGKKGVNIYDRKEKHLDEKHSRGGVIRVL